jgi:hypothetical protein
MATRFAMHASLRRISTTSSASLRRAHDRAGFVAQHVHRSDVICERICSQGRPSPSRIANRKRDMRAQEPAVFSASRTGSASRNDVACSGESVPA